MILDYHMHLRHGNGDDVERTDHSIEAVERYVAAAADAGVDEIGITEHVYYFVETRPLWHIPYELEHCVCELETYVAAVVAAKERGLPVKLGLEVDVVPGREVELRAMLDGVPWDFWLGSVHYVDDLAIDGSPRLIDEVGVEQAWRRYFERVALGAESGLYDSLSHPDLVKIWGERPSAEVEEEIFESFAERIASTGVCVEISSVGLLKPVAELYPDRRLLESCHRRGVPITLASDAHDSRRVGADLDRAVALARDVGYETVTVFEERRSRQVPLG